MSQSQALKQHKAAAQQLRVILAEQGIIIQHAHALHIVAAAYGLPNWNTLAARPQTPVLGPQQTVAGMYKRLSEYSDKEPSLSVGFDKGRLTAITYADPDEPKVGSDAWFERMDRKGIPVFVPITADEMAAQPDGHFLKLGVVQQEGGATPPPQQLFKQVSGPEPEMSSGSSAEAIAAELLALLEKKAVRATEQEAREWAPKLKGLSQDTPESMLKIRRMVYDTYLSGKQAAQAKGKKHKGRQNHENEMLLRALCNFAGVKYAPPYDPVREAALEEIMSDPFLQAEWFEELDIMN